MKKVLHKNGQIIDWQDHAMFGYAPPVGEEQLLEVTEEQWNRRDSYKSVQGGGLSEKMPPSTPVDTEKQRESVKALLRTMRAPMLDALSGIAGRSARNGDNQLSEEADALALALLDITNDPALNAADTYEAMQAAGVEAYKRIASTVSPSLASVFREITGG